MKLITKFMALGLLTAIHMHAEYGCMDNSYHTAQLNDPKQYYHVTGADGGPCSCPCSKYCAQYRCSLAQGQCPVCRHYRIPRAFAIVRKNNAHDEFPVAHSYNRYKMPLLRKRIATTTKQAQS